MGHFSMEKSLNPGSVLGGNQHLAVCTELADRHYILDLGRIVYEGRREEFIADAAVKDRYLGVGA